MEVYLEGYHLVDTIQIGKKHRFIARKNEFESTYLVMGGHVHAVDAHTVYYTNARYPTLVHYLPQKYIVRTYRK